MVYEGALLIFFDYDYYNDKDKFSIVSLYNYGFLHIKFVKF